MSTTSASTSTPRATSLPWLFSCRVDLLTFTGSAVLSLVLVAIGFQLGLINRDTPEWTWVTSVLLIDVAHVYATGFRVYFDREELRRRPWLYGLAPALSFAIGMAIYSEDPRLFWRVLAYLAVFHFIRQQYGWVALYRARGQETDRFGKAVDSVAIYLATLYPLIFWHANLPREFDWFVSTDFVAGPAWLELVTRWLYRLSLIAYTTRSLYQGIRWNRWNPGKDLVVLTTAVCWYVGIVGLNSDYAFTVTNVIIHGIPYMVLVYWTQKRNQWSARPRTLPARLLRFVGLIWLLAYFEELLWDRAIWGERAWLFGQAWHKAEWQNWLVPLLAVPQITHYILDGFIWRRRSNRDLRKIAAAESP